MRAAALTEVIVLGQTTPYSKELMVERYVIQLAPEFGGIVTEVHAKPNVPMKKGEPIFSMDAAPWQDKLDKAKAELEAAQNEKKSVEAKLAEADLKLRDAVMLVPKKVMAAQQLDIRQDRVDGLKAQIAGIDSQMDGLQADVDKAQYNVDHATIVAPADGYLVDLVLRPGAFVRLKTPVATYVSTEELFLLASVDQRAAQWIRPGDEAHFALSMYPGRIFKAEVDRCHLGHRPGPAPGHRRDAPGRGRQAEQHLLREAQARRRLLRDPSGVRRQRSHGHLHQQGHRPGEGAADDRDPVRESAQLRLQPVLIGRMSGTDHVSSRSTPSSWRFAYLLVALLLLIALHPFFVGNVWEPLLLNLFFSLVIIASVFAVSRSTTTRMVAFILALPVLGSRWLIHFFPVEALTLFALVAGAAFVAFVVVRILLCTCSDKRRSPRTLSLRP